jgi:hypothetical protein
MLRATGPKRWVGIGMLIDLVLHRWRQQASLNSRWLDGKRIKGAMKE